MFRREFIVGKDGLIQEPDWNAILGADLFPQEIKIVNRFHDVLFEQGGCYRENRSIEWNSPSYWTSSVKWVLYGLALEAGYLPYPRPNPMPGDLQQLPSEKQQWAGEWLWDFVWLNAFRKCRHPENDSGNAQELDWRTTTSVRLACECEWGTSADALQEDFLKLTVALADLRLFIYDNHPISVHSSGCEHTVDPVDVVKDLCPLSRGFRYLLLGFPRWKAADRRLRIDAWTV
jgi:hypothetical protein